MFTVEVHLINSIVENLPITPISTEARKIDQKATQLRLLTNFSTGKVFT